MGAKNRKCERDDNSLRSAARKLKIQIARLKAENEALREAIQMADEPEETPPRKKRESSHEEPPKMTLDEWRRNFVKEFRPAKQRKKKDE